MLTRHTADLPWNTIGEDDDLGYLTGQVTVPPARHIALDQRELRHVAACELEVLGDSHRYPLRAGELLVLPEHCRRTAWNARFWPSRGSSRLEADLLSSITRSLHRNRVGFAVGDCLWSPAPPRETVWDFVPETSAQFAEGTPLFRADTAGAKWATLEVTAAASETPVTLWGRTAAGTWVFVGGDYRAADSDAAIFSELAVHQPHGPFDVSGFHELDIVVKGFSGSSVYEPAVRLTLHYERPASRKVATLTCSTSGAVSYVPVGSIIQSSPTARASYIVYNPSASAGTVRLAIYNGLPAARLDPMTLVANLNVGVAPGAVGQGAISAYSEGMGVVRIYTDGAVSGATIQVSRDRP